MSIPEPSSELKRRVRRGFREATAPYGRELQLRRKELVRHVAVHRLDPDYLLPRGGGARGLLESIVIVVGVGSVGGAATELLASAGVGQLHLVDPDKLTPENIHRHVLGMDRIGEFKATALANQLARRFPDQTFSAQDLEFESILPSGAKMVESADCILFATGDHTFELRMNQVLGERWLRVHTWVEPLGLGGHVLTCGGKAVSGCLRCLYSDDDIHGLVNRAAFLGAGQAATRTVGGCSGTFTPFSRLDATRTALLAAHTCLEGLRDEAPSPYVISWRGDSGQAEDLGYQLSPRARRFDVGEERLDASFHRPECRECGDARTL